MILLWPGQMVPRTAKHWYILFLIYVRELGIPIAESKSVGPTTVLVFLGLEIDSLAMTIRIPLNRIEELRQLLENNAF